jgi:hypothetical protein
MEISPRLCHVSRNLLAQLSHGREFHFVPQPFQETNLDLGLRSQLKRVKVQKMCLNGE